MLFVSQLNLMYHSLSSAVLKYFIIVATTSSTHDEALFTSLSEGDGERSSTLNRKHQQRLKSSPINPIIQCVQTDGRTDCQE